MVALKSERRVYMWRVVPTIIPKEAPKSATLEEIIDILKTSYDAESAEIYLTDTGRVLPLDAPETAKDRRNRVYIADFSDETDSVIFLINRGDPFAADPAFINAASGEVHPVAPGRDESQGWSAHLVISKTEVDGVYRAGFERMPHSTSSYAETLFRTLLERHAKAAPEIYTYAKRVKRGRNFVTETRQYRPHFSVRKVPSEQIKADLDRGEISTITLIKSHADYAGPDAPDLIRSVQNRLIIRPKAVTKERIVDYIAKLSPWARTAGFDEIQFNLVKLPGNASASPRFALEVEDATETLYVRSQRLTGFDEFLDTCYAHISQDIKKKIIELLNDNEKW
jgi:hypothetical protein